MLSNNNTELLNRLEHKDVFELIRKHDLYGVIKNMILKLMQLDSEKAIALFLERNKIPPEVVVEQLDAYSELLYQVIYCIIYK